MVALTESRSDMLARSAALEPAASAAARFWSIWRRNWPLVTRSPSWAARLTIWPITRADSSTLFSAWILPLAVTFATMSSLATLAARTGTSLPL